MSISYIYWKRGVEKKYRKLGIGFRDSNFAAMEAANLLRRGLDVKIKTKGKFWFDSRFLR